MRNQKIAKLSILGLFLNIFLVLFKMIVGVLTHSIAIILDAINNLTDALSAIISLIGIKLSSKKPDKEHPFGHGRIEYIAAIIVAIIVFLTGLAFFKESINKIINPVDTKYSIISIILLVIFIFVKYFYGVFVKKQGKLLNSNSLKVTGIDAINDAYITLSTLIAALLCLIYNINIEGYIALIISIYVLKNAIDILKETINDMIGTRADIDLVNRLKTIIIKNNLVLGVYDIEIHSYGPSNIRATAYIQVDDDTKAKEIHKITRSIAVDVYEKMGINLTLGIYAVNDDKKYINIKKYIMKTIKDYKNILQLHGFYVDEESKNISFDLLFNFDEENSELIAENINKIIKEKYPEYNYSIIIDRDYSE